MQAPPISKTTAFVGGTALVGAVFGFSMAKGKGVGTRIGAALSGGLTALFTGEILAGAFHGVREMSQEFQRDAETGQIMVDDFGRPVPNAARSSLPPNPSVPHDPRPKEIIEREQMPKNPVTQADAQPAIAEVENILESISHRRMTPDSAKTTEDLDFKLATDPSFNFETLLRLQRQARTEGRVGGKAPSKS